MLEDLRRTTEAAAIAAARSALALPPAGDGVPTLSQHWRDRRRHQRGLSPLHHSPIHTSPSIIRSSLLIDRSSSPSSPSSRQTLSSPSSPPPARRYSESVERQRRYNLTRTSPILSLSDDDPIADLYRGEEQIESQWPRGLTPPSPRPAGDIEREIIEEGDFQDDWGATNDILPEYMTWRMPPSMDERGGRRNSRSGSRNATVMKWRWNKYKRERG